MIIEVSGKDFEVTDKVRDLVLAKMGKLQKLLSKMDDDMATANIKITEGSRWGYRVSFSMNLPQKERIYAEEKDSKLETALTMLREQVERQIMEYKDRLQDYGKGERQG